MGKPRNVDHRPAHTRDELNEKPDADEGHGMHVDYGDKNEYEQEGLDPRTRELQYICPEQVEEKEPEVPLDVVAEDLQKPHVPEEVPDRPMKKMDVTSVI